MPSRSQLVARLCATLMLCALPARAQEQNDGTLHVLRPVMHAEQEDAEFCLEFDHDLASDRNRAASVIKLESSGKTLPLRAQNISTEGALLCLQSLERGREYRVSVNGLRGTKSEKLAGTYSLTFTPPDRQPSLAFAGDADAGGLLRWDDVDPVLRSVNVPHVHLELFKIANPALMAAAWRDRGQTALAPSESSTFAHDHGEKIWSGELDMRAARNKNLEQTVALREALKDLRAGLYLITARAPEAKTETETGTAGLAATGAAWLLRSDLRLGALRDSAGFYVVAENAAGLAAAPNIRLMIADQNAEILAETRSDAQGLGFFGLGADKRAAASFIMGVDDTGNIDFADLSGPGAVHFMAPKNEAFVKTDRPFYAPGDTASVTLALRNAAPHTGGPATGGPATDEPATGGGAVLPSGTFVQLMRPDGTSYGSVPLPAGAAGMIRLDLPVPASAGVWSVQWQQADGGVLAKTALHVTSNPDAPRLEMSADRAIVPVDGAVNVALKSVTEDGRPAPYVTGRLFVSWLSPDNIFKEWKGYAFGTGSQSAGDVKPLVSFITDEKGVVSLHLSLVPPSDHLPLHSAHLSVKSDPAAGAADPAPLVLPLRPKEDIIGIK
ncbi:MAG: hypothetical protein M3N08_10020, partial [Pseudomonadota bacterium]|nr:hypothetical protein [Pseudomonadota bacterium]